MAAHDEALNLEDNEFDLDDSDEEEQDDNNLQNEDMEDLQQDDDSDGMGDDDEDDDEKEQQPNFPQTSGFNHNDSDNRNSDEEESKAMNGAKKVENQAHDMEFELDDSEEIDTEEEQDQVPSQTKNANAAAATNAHDIDDDEEVAGAYNPKDYAHLNVSAEVKELFEYIGRYKPQRIDLETSFRPFIPEFIPNVGEVDAFIKMPKPDGSPETLGIEGLDEPALNTADKAFLEMKYIQVKKTKKQVELKVHSIENAEKNPKDIQNWIKNINELHLGRPPATVNFAKPMPNFDDLMEVWPPSVEQVLRSVPFPGPDLGVSVEDYSRMICMMLDIPIHNLPDNKGVIEALYVVFTLYSEFKANQHFQKQQEQADAGNTDSMAF